jgi:tRNA-2-methylthio-N6-dimethylallyladenosine synthase
MKLPNMLEAKKRNNGNIEYLDYINNNNLKSIGIGKKYFIRTYGCQMNEHDSEKIRGILSSANFEEIDDMDSSDLIILNTCAIRENVHDKVFGLLGRIKHLKKAKPWLVVGICGCMAQEENVVNTILEKYPWVNFVFGTHNINNLLNILNNYFETSKQQIEVFSCEGDVIEHIPSKRDSKITAWVDIIYGCDKFCTYCIVPYTRGKQRSRKHENIVEEVLKLKNNGYKEITLLGQNVNAYGKDLYNDYTLANLLKDVSDTGIDRIRFVTSHPWDFTDQMIKVIKENKNIMPYIHLPIQSGSNKILKLMGRKYTKEDYLTLYDKIRNEIDGVSITTDIIVGFPGETEEDFNETLDIVEKCKFDGAFTFIFSKRENTPAALMEETISDEEKNDRLQRLNKRINYYSNLSNKKMIDLEVKCLILGTSEKDDTKLMGYTENMKLVNIEGDKKYIGTIQKVKITDTKSFSLNGKLI